MDPTVPIFSREDIQVIIDEIEKKIEAAKSFSEGAEFRYGVRHTETAYYCGAEATGWEYLHMIVSILGLPDA